MNLNLITSSDWVMWTREGYPVGGMLVLYLRITSCLGLGGGISLNSVGTRGVTCPGSLWHSQGIDLIPRLYNIYTYSWSPTSGD